MSIKRQGGPGVQIALKGLALVIGVLMLVGAQSVGSDIAFAAMSVDASTKSNADQSATDATEGGERDAEVPMEDGSGDTPIDPTHPAESAEPDDPAGNSLDPSEDQAEPYANNLPLSRMTASASVLAASAPWGERANTRLSGANRYSTAVAVSKHAYPSTVNTVIVATAHDFPDSLSAAPLAAKLRAPLLLTDPQVLSSETKAEIQRLKPTTILVIGGPGAISEQVMNNELRPLAQNIERLWGSDRYETSVKISQKWVAGSSLGVFVATGTDYPDALAAGAAAAKLGAPVLLVPGGASVSPASTSAELTRLGVTKVHIAGATGAVSMGIQQSLTSAPSRSVVRYGGSNRYVTATEIVNGVFSDAADVYWADANGFADALTGAAAAGARGGALLLVDSTCVPSIVYGATDRLVPSNTFVLGGSGVLTDSVLRGNECMSYPDGANESDFVSAQKLYDGLNQLRFNKGLTALRVSDSQRGTPASIWAMSIASKTASLQPSLSKQQPWARYQVVLYSSAGGDRVDRLLSLLAGDKQSQRWLMQPSGGARGFVSVGYASNGAKSTAVVYFGSGLR